MSKTNKKFGSNQGLLTLKQKKISFFSAILLVAGSSIGAGIFLKNGEILNNVQGSIILSLFSWIVAIIAVICMGVSLIEVSSVNTENNGGVIGWSKIFTNPYIFKASKNFMVYIYLPINFFIMPYYAVMTIQDAFGWQTHWWVVFLIAFAIALWFLFSSGLFAKVGDIQNKIITSVKFLPLLFAILVGFILVIAGQSQVGSGSNPHWWISNDFKSEHSLMSTIFPLTGILASIPTIIFTFDGFYSVCGIETEMQHPEKTGKAIVIGLLIVAIIDIFVSVSLLIGSSSGKINTIYWFTSSSGTAHCHWVITIVQLFIAIGVLGITNGFSLMTTRFYEYLIKNDELWSPNRFKSQLNPSNPKVGCIWTFAISVPIFIIFTLIGAFGYSDTSNYAATTMISVSGNFIGYGYDIGTSTSLSTLYSFCDIIANWTSILIFMCIVGSLIGCLIKRNNNSIKTKHIKGFVPCAIISSVIISLGVLFIVISTIGNIPIVSSWYKDIGQEIDGSIYTYSSWLNSLIGAIMMLCLLIVFVGISFIPGIVAIRQENNKLKYKKQT